MNNRKNIKGVLPIMLLSITLLSMSAESGFAESYQNQPDGLYAELDTTRGKILLSLEYEKTPMTVANFTGLAEGKIDGGKGKNKPFYDGLKFHRVIDNFMIQGGCPLGTGTGNPGYSFPDEFDSTLKHSGPGILSMANSGPGSNGSQFFITHTATPWLDGKHTVFGKVIEGQKVVDAIKQGDKLNSVKIFRNGKKAEAFKNDQNSFSALVKSSKENMNKKASAQLEKDKAIVAKKWPSAKKTDSGLMYIVEREGNGSASPVMGSPVTTHYRGTLLDGKVFDSSYDRGEPLQFSVGQVIQGWNEALMSMKKGEKRTLIIPPELGYGSAGAGGGVIPPNAWLVFEVELLDFK
ncbi:MAG: peptidylprolyl isomerase [Spirochaetia bacterium]|nr:peptidylprolyl isomerase [Spirochaetia bacterium]